MYFLYIFAHDIVTKFQHKIVVNAPNAEYEISALAVVMLSRTNIYKKIMIPCLKEYYTIFQEITDNITGSLKDMYSAPIGD